MLPNLIIIGAMKCATTSLFYYLSQHPQIQMSREKELNFFIEERNWWRGVDWYLSHFRGDEPVHGEASPNYTHFSRFDGVPARMHAIVPDAKLIYVVRDPIERLVSNYIHKCADGSERRPFPEAIFPLETSRYVIRSQYFRQLERFLEFFPASRILILTREDLKHRRLETLRTVFRFLGVDESFECRAFEKELHLTSRKRRPSRVGHVLTQWPTVPGLNLLPPGARHLARYAFYYPLSTTMPPVEVDEDLRRRLADLFVEDVRRLEAFAGRSFDEWSL